MNTETTVETRQMVFEKLKIYKGDKFKLHHSRHENQNKYTDVIFECDGENILCPKDVNQNVLLVEISVGRYFIEKQ